MDLEMADRALGAGPVNLEREAAGRAGGEAQLDRRLGHEPGLEVVAVEVQRERPVGRPLERDLVALLDPDEPLASPEAGRP